MTVETPSSAQQIDIGIASSMALSSAFSVVGTAIEVL